MQIVYVLELAHFDKIDDNIDVQRIKTIHSCVELFPIDSLPFSTLSSFDFCRLLEDKLRAFKTAGCGLNLSDRHVYEITKRT